MAKRRHPSKPKRKQKRKARREKVAARNRKPEQAGERIPFEPPAPSLTPRIDAMTDGSVCRLYRELGGENFDVALDAARVTVDFYRMELEDRRRVLANPRASEDERNRRLTISPTVGVRAIRAIADLLKQRAALREECRREIAIIRARTEQGEREEQADSTGASQDEEHPSDELSAKSEASANGQKDEKAVEPPAESDPGPDRLPPEPGETHAA